MVQTCRMDRRCGRRAALLTILAALIVRRGPWFHLAAAFSPASAPAELPGAGCKGLRRRSLLSDALIGTAAGGIVFQRGIDVQAVDLSATDAAPDDVRLLQNAFSAVRRLGDFPSRIALQDAEAQLASCLSRSRMQMGLLSQPAQMSLLLRTRASVRLKAGDRDGAMQDVNEAVEMWRALSPGDANSEELAQVLMVRAEALGSSSRWREALADYDRAAEMLGEPVEDAALLIGRAEAKRRVGQMEAAAEDFDAGAELLKRAGYRVEAEIETERAGVALLGAGGDRLQDADEHLCGVIRRSIGLMSDDVALLQRLVIADCHARVAMAALSWHKGRNEVAEAYWRDACARLDTLAEDAEGKMLAIGFPNGRTYRCDRYGTDIQWLEEELVWPKDAVSWLVDFFRKRSGALPQDSFLTDLSVGKRPGEGTSSFEVAQQRGWRKPVEVERAIVDAADAVIRTRMSQASQL